MLVLIAVVLAAAIGWGPPAHRLEPASSHHARAALARRATLPPGSVEASPFTASNGAESCRLRARGLTAIVELDSAPQPYTRMEREVVEFGQNVEWTRVPRRAYPRTVAISGSMPTGSRSRAGC